MSEAAAAELPPFAAPYLPDFEQLARMLERAPGFLLQPVEAPTPDLARVFAAWLGRQGWNVQVCELRDADSLRALAAELVRPSGAVGRDLMIVVQSGELDDAATRASFAALNMARDPIARARPAPLLWWGSSVFMRTTWTHAPDWWSVAATPLRIPFRRILDLPSHLPFGAYWWTGAVNEWLPRLEEDLASSRAHGDPAGTARSGLQLAEAQLSRGDRLDARATLAGIRAGVDDHAKALLSRWMLLAGAVDAADAADAGVSVEALRTQISAAEAGGAELREIGLRLQLAERLESGDARMLADALKEYVRARQRTAARGDLATTLAIDAHIILDLAQLTDDPLRAEMDRYAADAEDHTEDPLSRARAALTRAKLALMNQAVGVGESFAYEALRQACRAADPVLETVAHCLIATACGLKGDFAASLDHASTTLTGALAADSRPLQIQARTLRAQAYTALGDPRAAACECVELWELISAFEHQAWLWCALLSKMADLAWTTGDPAAAARLTLASVLGHLEVARWPERDWIAVDLDALAANEPTTVRDIEAAIALGEQAAESGLDDDTKVRLEAVWRALHAEAARLDESLDAAGVTAIDPRTWRGR